MSIQFFLGYPEPDAGCPFAIWLPLEEDVLLVAGILNRGPVGFQDIESERVPWLTEEDLNQHMNGNGLHKVSSTHASWWIVHAFKMLDVEPFAEWELVEILQPTNEVPPFRNDQQGLYILHWLIRLQRLYILILEYFFRYHKASFRMA